MIEPNNNVTLLPFRIPGDFILIRQTVRGLNRFWGRPTHSMTSFIHNPEDRS
jgi:hypothetical protein